MSRGFVCQLVMGELELGADEGRGTQVAVSANMTDGAVAGIHHHGKTQLVFVQGNLTARRYVDEVLRPAAQPHSAAG